MTVSPLPCIQKRGKETPRHHNCNPIHPTMKSKQSPTPKSTRLLQINKKNNNNNFKPKNEKNPPSTNLTSKTTQRGRKEREISKPKTPDFKIQLSLKNLKTNKHEPCTLQTQIERGKIPTISDHTTREKNTRRSFEELQTRAEAQSTKPCTLQNPIFPKNKTVKKKKGGTPNLSSCKKEQQNSKHGDEIRFLHGKSVLEILTFFKFYSNNKIQKIDG